MKYNANSDDIFILFGHEGGTSNRGTVSHEFDTYRDLFIFFFMNVIKQNVFSRQIDFFSLPKATT